MDLEPSAGATDDDRMVTAQHWLMLDDFRAIKAKCLASMPGKIGLAQILARIGLLRLGVVKRLIRARKLGMNRPG